MAAQVVGIDSHAAKSFNQDALLTPKPNLTYTQDFLQSGGKGGTRKYKARDINRRKQNRKKDEARNCDCDCQQCHREFAINFK